MSEAGAPSQLSPQLPLELSLDGEATVENFSPRSSLGPLLAILEGPLEAMDPLSYLHGPASSGKSHLLQALCHRHVGAVYLPLEQLASLPAAALFQDLEHSTAVAIDDLQCVSGEPAWEEALFHLVNRARGTGCPVYVAASAPAGDIGIRLPDLRSRLGGGLIWALPDCSEDEKKAILAFRARRRGLDLSTSVIDYLCARGSRALPDLLTSLAQLDRASLQLQRPVTVPLVREAMGW